MADSQSIAPAKVGARGRLVFDPGWCRTCKVCEMVCSTLKEGRSGHGLSCITVRFDEFDAEAPVSASFCVHCEEAPCIEACPTEALHRHPRTGAVVVDHETCIGCMACRRVCPWEAPKRHPQERRAIKCDLCSDREGGPLCVEMCPLSGKALRYEPNYYEGGDEG